MICAPNFLGDDDERVFDMQHSCYSKALWTIVEAARERYVDAESILRCSAPIGVQVHELRSIDHRTVQGIHDVIAAWYRFKRKTDYLPSLQSDLSGDWLRFATAEAITLSKSADFVTGVLDACIHANTEIGSAGEERAKDIQRQRYSQMFKYTFWQPEVEP